MPFLELFSSSVMDRDSDIPARLFTQRWGRFADAFVIETGEHKISSRKLILPKLNSILSDFPKGLGNSH